MIKWFDRKFDFENNPYDIAALKDRLAAFPAKLEAQLRSLPETALTKGKWSVKEHIGHLADLEPLWQGRLDDILSGEKELRITDLQNTKTDLAGHNDTPLSELLSNFAMLRMLTIGKIASVQPADLSRSALHPRMKTPMRIADHLLFVAEHDDHHLNSIIELIS